MVFAKGHAKFQANRSRRSRVIALTCPIRMQYAICHYFGHKIVSISLNFRKTALERTFFFSKIQKKKHLRISCFFSDRASKLIRLKNGFCQGPCKISSQSVEAFSSYHVNGPNTHAIRYLSLFRT